jgi:hypothetical protein
VRAGGGGSRPLVDRGRQLVDGGPPALPGEGPARYFARAGFAGMMVDGPHEGLRNVTNGDEDFLIFNIQNPTALRDNIGESAAELALFAHIVPTVVVDASGCPGADPAPRFDGSRMAMMGHSMGATIAPLALAVEPRYGAVVLSGAGGSWIENVLYKQKPLAIGPLAELLLGYQSTGQSLRASDPVLTLLQWAAEGADPQAYAAQIVSAPPPGMASRHVLVLQGIVDHYILPNIANALTVPLGLDLAGPSLDQGVAELDALEQTPLVQMLTLDGRSPITLPATGNRMVAGTPVTAVVVQHPGDNIEDGHEVVFQTDPPKHQYRCFLASYAAGLPVVVPDGTADASCP